MYVNNGFESQLQNNNFCLIEYTLLKRTRSKSNKKQVKKRKVSQLKFFNFVSLAFGYSLFM